MQSHTDTMLSLLGQIRKQMNGALLDTFRYYGSDYGVNYGVTIHTLRDIARSVGEDDDLARFLYRQQVRELRLIAAWIASPDRVKTLEDLQFWAVGIVNSEVAEQLAQALLSRIADIDMLLTEWCCGDNELLAYAALLAASRSTKCSVDRCCFAISTVATHFPDNRLAAQGVVALAASMLDGNESRKQILHCIEQLDDSATVSYVRDEIAWRAEY